MNRQRINGFCKLGVILSSIFLNVIFIIICIKQGQIIWSFVWNMFWAMPTLGFTLSFIHYYYWDWMREEFTLKSNKENRSE